MTEDKLYNIARDSFIAEIMRADSFFEPTELLPLINQYSLSVPHVLIITECTQENKTLKISEKYENT